MSTDSSFLSFAPQVSLFPGTPSLPCAHPQGLILRGSLHWLLSLNSYLQEDLVQWDVAEAAGHLEIREEGR